MLNGSDGKTVKYRSLQRAIKCKSNYAPLVPNQTYEIAIINLSLIVALIEETTILAT